MAVKCEECGFLALRDREFRVTVEADHSVRSGAKFDQYEVQIPSITRTVLLDKYTFRPLCFRLNKDQVAQAEAAEQTHESFLQIIREPRECDKFQEWTPGFSPKEHAEMGMMEMQRKREDRRDRFQFTIHAIEIFVVASLAVAAMRTQYATTQMQIEATVKAAVQSHHEEQMKKTVDAALSAPISGSTPDATAPANQ